VIEYARNVLGKAEANSTEFDADCPEPAVIFMPEGSRTHMGGTMRLGLRATLLQTSDCHAARLYRPDDATVHERHRHRCAASLSVQSVLHRLPAQSLTALSTCRVFCVLLDGRCGSREDLTSWGGCAYLDLLATTRFHITLYRRHAARLVRDSLLCGLPSPHRDV
jgi:hypothetical protein